MSTSTAVGVELLNSPVRRMIVDFLAGSGEAGETVQMTAAQLAELLELHVTTARFHLDQLVTAGILEAVFVREGVGRPRKVYRLASGSLTEEGDSPAMRILTELLADSFAAQLAGDPVTPYEAGRRWAEEHIPAEPAERAATPGAWLAKIGRLVDVLGTWGYTPNLSVSGSGRVATLQLDRCPFLDLARTNPAVVCGIHRGLISGALARFGEDGVDVSLEPFVGPQHCLARITTTNPFTPSTAPPTPSKETA